MRDVKEDEVEHVLIRTVRSLARRGLISVDLRSVESDASHRATALGTLTDKGRLAAEQIADSE